MLSVWMMEWRQKGKTRSYPFPFFELNHQKRNDMDEKVAWQLERLMFIQVLDITCAQYYQLRLNEFSINLIRQKTLYFAYMRRKNNSKFMSKTEKLIKGYVKNITLITVFIYQNKIDTWCHFSSSAKMSFTLIIRY
jgi:hypothetical protein